MMSLPVSSSRQSQAFEWLARPIQRWIWEQRWEELWDIQERAIRGILHSTRDIIICAPTAGGKTEAAFLPLLSDVVTQPGNGGFDLVYIGPLRALINDQFRRLELLCEKLGVPVHPWHGDIAFSKKQRARQQPGGVLLITPESLEALFVRRGLEIPSLFKSTRAVVIDELHAVLDNARGMHLRSLLSRMQGAVGRRIRRIGLSATLSDMSLVASYLRPRHWQDVQIIASEDGTSELKVQVRAYLAREYRSDEASESVDATDRAIAKHLLRHLRGGHNLVFAGSRENVEHYSDLLRQWSERLQVPLEFYPHHGNLSRAMRENVETLLKSRNPTTAVCTTTLELGIDIGSIDCVGHIGAPFSVASLRQRLGRSGRRRGKAAILRMYNPEAEPGPDSTEDQRLHFGLIQSIATVELLIDRWCEPPNPHRLHLSTLVHQILSVVAQRNGARAESIHAALCREGPFTSVDRNLFVRLLRSLGQPGIDLIEQAPGGLLLLGPKGERIVEHYTFFAVFQTPDEYRIVADGKDLGTLVPRQDVIAPGSTIIFSGCRWCVIRVYDTQRVIEVRPDHSGKAPPFSGYAGGRVHDRVVKKMFEVLAGKAVPMYLDECARRLLENARVEFSRMGLATARVLYTSDESALIAAWCGTVRLGTLELALRAKDFDVSRMFPFLTVSKPGVAQALPEALRGFADGQCLDGRTLLIGLGNLKSEKFHWCLSPDLLVEDALGSVVDVAALPELAKSILDAASGNAGPLIV